MSAMGPRTKINNFLKKEIGSGSYTKINHNLLIIIQISEFSLVISSQLLFVYSTILFVIDCKLLILAFPLFHKQNRIVNPKLGRLLMH